MGEWGGAYCFGGYEVALKLDKTLAIQYIINKVISLNGIKQMRRVVRRRGTASYLLSRRR